MVIISDIKRAIIIIDLMLAPHRIIIMGPKATFGRLFKTIKYGSNTLYKNLLYQRIIANKVPMIVAKEKLIMVSYMVIHIWLNKLLVLYKLIIVFRTLLGEE